MANQNHFRLLSSLCMLEIAARHGESKQLNTRNETAAMLVGKKAANC